MTNNDVMYGYPTRAKEQADIEFKEFKKMYPHLSDEMIRAMAFSASGIAGRLSQILYPEMHDTPNTD